ncbi:exonuclease domain-containing protein [Flavobacterium sp. 7A]|uniref:exonuclease domain-containing protein n=1 Tax=Flavobacterium sp. 7A TaxID=2940571 RepID=UPI00222809BA|nr:exonuclease domain-containing protein [Flavobacterium sp. 7A]MCW2120149.1 DNA polymerase-3 subunit epsilon [Flavobacterium sp. 7A]
MYAILDIETTGGQFNEEGITEIAIYKFDGHEIVDQFISLVNPEIPIQPFVVQLTGINNAMLKSAPKFHEVAKRIVEMTADCIVVAHNASFDYRILRTEFRRLGYDFESHTICTVELAKKLIPEQPSYSLGKLVRALGIPVTDRHRASGDALATVKLFKMLLEKDVEKNIVKDFIKLEIEKGIAPKLQDIINKIPAKTGVYYIHNKAGDIINIGKSRNIKKRINQIFTGITNTSKKIQKEVFEVTYEETGNELIAILKETEAIKTNRPVYNRIPRRNTLPWSIYSEKDSNGYLNLKLQKTDGRKKDITSYNNESDGKNALFRITDDYQLCQKLTGLYITKSACFKHKIKECDGACLGEVSPSEYNERVKKFVEKNNFDNTNMVIIDRGRSVSERSAVLVENGQLKGYAFYDLNYQITKIDILKNILIPMPNNRDTKHTLQTYLKKNKGYKILKF